ncbi:MULTISPECIES: STAS domain-containing protein [unclassified Micromonospora]|uniref:STAS domain-containing protein n=1 Tax=unclassified Micromonospora TaxID=2617518 RepID=UPI00333499CA
MDLHVRDPEPDRVVLCPAGEVDMATADALGAAITDALGRPGVREVLVDLADVGFLDSSGVRVLVHGVALARERDVTLRVANPQPVVARVLRITAVGALLGLPDDHTERPAARGRRGLG